MRRKLLEYQKHWTVHRGHTLKAPFHVPDSLKHVENDIYIIARKVLHKLVGDLKFDNKDLEHYDALNNDVTFLKEQSFFYNSHLPSVDCTLHTLCPAVDCALHKLWASGCKFAVVLQADYKYLCILRK